MDQFHESQSVHGARHIHVSEDQRNVLPRFENLDCIVGVRGLQHKVAFIGEKIDRVK